MNRRLSYSMKILNDPNGPKIFIVMCIGLVIVTHLYFVINGWIEPLMTLSGLR